MDLEFTEIYWNWNREIYMNFFQRTWPNQSYATLAGYVSQPWKRNIYIQQQIDRSLRFMSNFMAITQRFTWRMKILLATTVWVRISSFAWPMDVRWTWLLKSDTIKNFEPTKNFYKVAFFYIGPVFIGIVHIQSNVIIFCVMKRITSSAYLRLRWIDLLYADKWFS